MDLTVEGIVPFAKINSKARATLPCGSSWMGRSDMYARVRNLIVILIGCSASAWADEQFVASTFSKAAIYVYSSDFIYEPVTEWFTQEELSSLEEHRSELNLVIQNALNFGDSVGGAALTAHFRAIEETAELPIHEVIQPTQREIDELFAYLESPERVNYYWAKWLARKLLLLESPG